VEHGQGDFDLDVTLMAEEQDFKVAFGEFSAAAGTADFFRKAAALVFKVEPVSALRTIKNMLKHQKIPPADDESKVA
jgi:hypothetical protein